MSSKKIIWGLFFIAGAALLVLNQMGLLIGIGMWSLLFTLVLIPVFIQSLIRLEFFGMFFPLALLAIIYAEPLGIEKLVPWTVLLAALLLSLGFTILFKKERFWHRDGCRNKNDAEVASGWLGDIRQTDEDNIAVEASFGSSTRYIHSTNLQKVSVKCSFGSVKVFFDNASLSPEGAEMYIASSFGGVELYIPRAWRVINNVDTSFSGVDERHSFGEPPSSAPVITLLGNIRFSGIEVVYI